MATSPARTDATAPLRASPGTGHHGPATDPTAFPSAPPLQALILLPRPSNRMPLGGPGEPKRCRMGLTGALRF